MWVNYKTNLVDNISSNLVKNENDNLVMGIWCGVHPILGDGWFIFKRVSISGDWDRWDYCYQSQEDAIKQYNKFWSEYDFEFFLKNYDTGSMGE